MDNEIHEFGEDTRLNADGSPFVRLADSYTILRRGPRDSSHAAERTFNSVVGWVPVAKVRALDPATALERWNGAKLRTSFVFKKEYGQIGQTRHWGRIGEELIASATFPQGYVLLQDLSYCYHGRGGCE